MLIILIERQTATAGKEQIDKTYTESLKQVISLYVYMYIHMYIHIEREI